MTLTANPRRSFFTSLLDYGVELAMAVLPQDAMSMWVKTSLVRARGSKLGARVKIWRGVWVDDYRKLEIADDVTIGHGVILLCGGDVFIGARSMVGHGSKLISSGHRIPDRHDEPMRWSGPEQAPIMIAEDAWIGAGAILLGGTRIGRGAIVAAGAVVTKDVPDYAVVAGVPARVVRMRT
ncbi:acyltransferase [Thermomonas sp.]|uniref:acyltransferase n=1 Tax=Thermomonas sp. TaxID=1971895 RepID=UPI00262AFCF1|nr:acyltransferase [Thermomonas sp.]